MRKRLGRTNKRAPMPSIDTVVEGSRWRNRSGNVYRIESIDGDYVLLVPIAGGRRTRKYRQHVIFDMTPVK